MSIEDKKITEAEIQQVAVESVHGEKLIGSATENKKIFDRFGRFLAGKFNELIEELKNSPISKDKISYDDLSPEVKEKLDVHTESDHTHKNLELLNGLTDDNFVKDNIEIENLKLKGSNGSYGALALNSSGQLCINVFDANGNLVNSLMLGNGLTDFAYPLNQSSGGTGNSLRFYDASNGKISFVSSVVSSYGGVKCWYFYYLHMVFFSFNISVKMDAGKFVKVAQLPAMPDDRYSYPTVPVAISVSSYGQNSTTNWKGRIKTDGSIDIACDSPHVNTAVSIYVTGFYFLN